MIPMRMDIKSVEEAHWRITHAQVAKTRLQLDGELQSRAAAHGSAPYKKVYNNAFDALKKTWQSEGVKGKHICVSVRCTSTADLTRSHSLSQEYSVVSSQRTHTKSS